MGLKELGDKKRDASELILSGGIIFALVLVAAIFFYGVRVSATHNPSPPGSNISATTTDHWAWNDLVGWIQFHDIPDTLKVIVKEDRVEGYASSSAKELALDCSTAPQNTCSGGYNSSTPGSYRVLNNGCGVLGGWAWNDTYGWVSFSSTNHTGTVTYGVTISNLPGEQGHFKGYAWSEVIGWLSFNCKDLESFYPNFCSTTSNYRVVTAWQTTSTSAVLDSSVIDTGVPSGVQLNSIMWRGSYVGSGCPGGVGPGQGVQFQIAVGNTTSGAWTSAFMGPDGTSATYFNAPNFGVPVALTSGGYNRFTNYRYFRYRILLISDQNQTLSPVVDDIIVNWSP